MKVGVVGLGEVAQIIHLPILQRLPDRFEIAALCDVSPGLLRARWESGTGSSGATPMRRSWPRSRTSTAVFVLNSDEYHADHTIAALRHGKHVLVEKPMCLTLRARPRRSSQARDEAGVQVMVGLHAPLRAGVRAGGRGGQAAREDQLRPGPRHHRPEPAHHRPVERRPPLRRLPAVGSRTAPSGRGELVARGDRRGCRRSLAAPTGCCSG